MTDNNLSKLKRRRTTQRSNATRFAHQINVSDHSTPIDELQYLSERLDETLANLLTLDNAIQDLLDDEEYANDVPICEEYIDSSKRAIRKAKNLTNPTNSENTITNSTTTHNLTPPHSTVKLPTIKLQSFTGEIESWTSFWEQFESSVDKNPSLCAVNKHVFLRGYLEGEPKRLVDGIAVTGDTYEQTKEILKSRYGDNNRIIQSHLDYLENLEASVSRTPETLNDTYIECHRRIQALRALGEDVDSYGRILAPKILRAFPEDICRRWLIHAKRQKTQEGNLSKLMEFLNDEVEGAINSQKIRRDPCMSMVTSDTPIPTAASFHVNTKRTKSSRHSKRETESFCVYCEAKGHWGQDCQQIRNPEARAEKLKTAKRCFLCLRRGHNKTQCFKKGKASCSRCAGQHHVSICKEETTTQTSICKIGVTTVADFTYLQTIRVWLKGPTGRRKLTRCILDAGSQSSFIHHSLIDSLQLNVTDNKTLEIRTFESPSGISTSRRKVSFDILGYSTNARVSITAFESHNTYTSQPTSPRDITSIASFKKIKLADPTDGSPDLPIEALIGADYYWKIVSMKQPIRVSASLVLLPTVFGYAISGNRSGTSVNQVMIHHIASAVEKISDQDVRQFWELETIGIKEHQERALSHKDHAILQDFHDSYCMEDGRRVVSLPRRKDVLFSNNLITAENRFSSLENKLQSRDDLKATYHEHMLDYIRRDQVEIAPQGNTSHDVYYLPHHMVSKTKLEGTKYRIVFDASAHEPNSPSLNDALEMGPNLLPEILGTLLRFRKHSKAIACDGDQAFLQLTLHERDRDLTRFLWYRVERGPDGTYNTSDEVISYRFKRLPFGLTSSPFLLSATIRELATRNQAIYPTACAQVDKSTFMDDITTSVEDDLQAITMYEELTALLLQIKLSLSKWATNSKMLKEIWHTRGLDDRRSTSVLGVDWNTIEDCLSTNKGKISSDLMDRSGTKRNVLRATAQFYDPLGLFSPVGIVAKIIFQDTWIRGIAWEELLPLDLATKWDSWIKTLHLLSSIQIPRWIGIGDTSWNSDVHVFCDASERAYGAVLYVRSRSAHTSVVRIACSKNRLAPVKKVTLPRLELLAALIGTRLLQYFCQEISFDISKATLWSDSTVALGWIRNDPNKWKTFVSNRVTEIVSHTTPSQWRHCPGDQNPADYLTRGVSADQLPSLDIWWNGPCWLKKDDTWPADRPSHMPLPEAKKTPQVLTITATEPIIQASRFSVYWKLLHVTAWVFRFIATIKRKTTYPQAFSADELKNARMYWIKTVQQERFPVELEALKRGERLSNTSKLARYNPFLDGDVIRLGGRLQCAELSDTQKHPIILDGQHHFTHLLIRDTHVRLHHLGVRIVLGEIREEFWILRARQTIKKVLHSCLPCKIARSIPFTEVEAPLPLDRVRPTQPFSVTGVDFAGPLYVTHNGKVKKCYIALFTCAITRALHLELATDMSTAKFLMALQRFVSRRGIPHTIYSDNARTFSAANKELTELEKVFKDSNMLNYCAHQGITWKFIAPRAAWWGGFWERMVGSTKRYLRKILGRSQVDEEGLQTLLSGIEATLNSRPITEDLNGDNVLTPAHFLVGNKLTTIPYGGEPQTGKNLALEFQRKQRTLQEFWQQWKKEYLLQLRNYHEVRGLHNQQRSPKVGDVVLLQEDCRPRHVWKRARVERLLPGRDGRTRTIILQQPDGTRISRPTQLVIPLEIDQGGEDVGDLQVAMPAPSRS